MTYAVHELQNEKFIRKSLELVVLWQSNHNNVVNESGARWEWRRH